ncbi:radical SAM protein [candidate division KSB1 bacterium]|nr:radical SAM protein [candidate division KSB1 bacterium]
MKPILCNYYLTYRCNARCSFCDIWRNRRYPKNASANIDTVLRNLTELKSLGIRFIDFTGGEPLLYPELPRVLRHARKLKMLTSVTTNCLLYPQRAEQIKKLVSFLHFSLDSMIPAQHDELRGVPAFDSVMKSIDIAKALGEKPDLLFTVTEYNYSAAEALVRFSQQQRLILILNPVFKHLSQKSLSQQVLDFLNQFKNEPYIYMNRAFHHFRRHGGNQIERPRCKAVSSTIVISPENDLLLPCFHFACEKIPVKTSISAVRSSAKFMQIQKMQGRYSFCSGCSINCYFEPSFTVSFNFYTWLSLYSKARYIIDKYVRAKLENLLKRHEPDTT